MGPSAHGKLVHWRRAGILCSDELWKGTERVAAPDALRAPLGMVALEAPELGGGPGAHERRLICCHALRWRSRRCRRVAASAPRVTVLPARQDRCAGLHRAQIRLPGRARFFGNKSGCCARRSLDACAAILRFSRTKTLTPPAPSAPAGFTTATPRSIRLRRDLFPFAKLSEPPRNRTLRTLSPSCV